MSDTVRVVDHGPIREIRLVRPEVLNALDEELAESLTRVFLQIAVDLEAGKGPRGVLLTGEGAHFCAGADVNYMQRQSRQSVADNREDARRLSRMFQAVRGCPVYTIARVQGAALGGGSGLAACCDLVIAEEGARFGFTEVQFGILPAVISPFVIDRIGTAKARAYFPTGERFGAREAEAMGLVDRVVPATELDATVRGVCKILLAAAPGASRAAKRLIEMVAWRMPLQLDLERALDQELEKDPFRKNGALVFDPLGVGTRSTEPHEHGPDCEHEEDESDEPETSVFEETARWIAHMRASREGQDGLAAFLEKRKPAWNAEPPEWRHS